MICGSVYLLLFVLPTLITGQYSDGDIRLVGGSYQWEGRVEIYLSGTWGTITDSEWTNNDAQVVCRKLGYFRPGALQQTGAYFGEGSDPIHLDYVLCSGTEYNLTDCLIGNRTRQSSHSEDVGVKCQTIDSSYQEGNIRLVGGSYNWVGRVEVFYSGMWSSIYDTSWTFSDATVVCTQLGHSVENAVPRCCGYYGQGSGIIQVHSVYCSGDEGSLTSCSYSTSTTYNHQYDVGVQCLQGNDTKEGDIRLVGGSYNWEGRVEIYLNGEWGTITHYSSDFRGARVVCRQLGYDIRYGYVDRSWCCARFGRGRGPIQMANLQCSSTEYKLTDCTYSNNTDINHYAQDWSVNCNNDGPSSGEVRLYYRYNTPIYYRGIVEVYLSEEWGTVADDGSWTLEDGEVICRQLGYEISSTSISLSSYYNSYYRETTPVHMSNVQCSGTENRLTDCPHSSGGSGSGATLRCYNYAERCLRGNIRLVGGETDMEGRVEICGSNYGWGTVCNRQWTSSHTKVVCRNLGYDDTEGSYQESHTFGEGTIPILMDFVNCSGSEYGLWYCRHFTHSYGCSHSDDAGVHCQLAQCNNGDVRISAEELRGLLEVCINGRWATTCRDGWSSTDAAVVCRELGYSGGTTYYTGIYSRRKIQITGVSCYGNEHRLTDCDYSINELGECQYDDIGVTCSPADCVDGEIRLVEGDSEIEGRVEVCFSQRWGTISSDGWTQTNTKIVCSDLGYETATDLDYYTPRSATNLKPIYMNYVHCSGQELTLLDCSYSRNHSTNKHRKDVGIQCRKSSCDNGDLRLIGGDSEYEGLLQVCFDQRWGTINEAGWTASDTQVACRQLGFDAIGDYDTSKNRGTLSTPIFMDNVACYGTESKLIDCTYHTDTSEDEHSEDIWINCGTPTSSSTPVTPTRNSTPVNDIPTSDPTRDITAATDKQTSDKQPQTTSTVSLVVAFIALGSSILVTIFLIGYTCKQKNKKRSNESVYYRNNEYANQTSDEQVTKKPYPNTSTQRDQESAAVNESASSYQPLTTGTFQKDGVYTTIEVGKRSGMQFPLTLTRDEDIYDTCT